MKIGFKKKKHSNLSRSFFTVSSVSVFLVPLTAWAQQSTGNSLDSCGTHMMGWGSGWTGAFIAFVFLFMIIALVVTSTLVFGRWNARDTSPHAPPGRQPLAILEERFARGEIDKEEFEEKRRIIGD